MLVNERVSERDGGVIRRSDYREASTNQDEHLRHIKLEKNTSDECKKVHCPPPPPPQSIPKTPTLYLPPPFLAQQRPEHFFFPPPARAVSLRESRSYAEAREISPPSPPATPRIVSFFVFSRNGERGGMGVLVRPSPRTKKAATHHKPQDLQDTKNTPLHIFFSFFFKHGGDQDPLLVPRPCYVQPTEFIEKKKYVGRQNRPLTFAGVFGVGWDRGGGEKAREARCANHIRIPLSPPPGAKRQRGVRSTEHPGGI